MKSSDEIERIRGCFTLTGDLESLESQLRFLDLTRIRFYFLNPKDLMFEFREDST